MDFYSATVPNFASVDIGDDFFSGLGFDLEDSIDPTKINSVYNIKKEKNLKQSKSDSTIKVESLNIDFDDILNDQNSSEDNLSSMSSLSYDFVVRGEAYQYGDEAASNHKNVNNSGIYEPVVGQPSQQYQRQTQHGTSQLNGAPREMMSQRMTHRFSPEAMSSNFETIVKRSLNQNLRQNNLDSGFESGYLNRISPDRNGNIPSGTRRVSPRRSSNPDSDDDNSLAQATVAASRLSTPATKKVEKKSKDVKYLERRRKNNLAAHKSRLKVKMKQQQIIEDNSSLVLENEQLKTKVAFLHQEIEKLKSLL